MAASKNTEYEQFRPEYEGFLTTLSNVSREIGALLEGIGLKVDKDAKLYGKTRRNHAYVYESDGSDTIAKSALVQDLLTFYGQPALEAVLAARNISAAKDLETCILDISVVGMKPKAFSGLNVGSVPTAVYTPAQNLLA